MYAIVMYRFGAKQNFFETHSYVLGVFSNKQKAIFQSNVEMLARAGKYNAYMTYVGLDDVTIYKDEEGFSNGWIEYEYSEDLEDEIKRRYQLESLV